MPKNRIIRTADGEPGLNYLCAGLKKYFAHALPEVERIVGGFAQATRSNPEAFVNSHQLSVFSVQCSVIGLQPPPLAELRTVTTDYCSLITDHSATRPLPPATQPNLPVANSIKRRHGQRNKTNQITNK